LGERRGNASRPPHWPRPRQAGPCARDCHRMAETRPGVARGAQRVRPDLALRGGVARTSSAGCYSVIGGVSRCFRGEHRQVFRRAGMRRRARFDWGWPGRTQSADQADREHGERHCSRAGHRSLALQRKRTLDRDRRRSGRKVPAAGRWTWLISHDFQMPRTHAAAR
jgi:hypothetical protein